IRALESRTRIGLPLVSSFKERARFDVAKLESLYSEASKGKDSRSEAAEASSRNCDNEISIVRWSRSRRGTRSSIDASIAAITTETARPGSSVSKYAE